MPGLRVGLLMLLGSASFAVAARPALPDKPLSERRVSYRIEVSLDPEARTLTGRERVTWRNPDQAPVGVLQFHLYLNAFRDERSTFMRESGGRHRQFSQSGEEGRGRIEIRRMTVAGAGAALHDVTGRIRFIQPDDGNVHDRTVVEVELPRPAAPGETIRLDIDFEATLPKVLARTGWERFDSGDLFFLVGQWFPKLGVYEEPGRRYVPADAPHGAWNTHQFHANSEFYADFGVYDVAISTPEDYVVGATGMRVGETSREGIRTVRYRAEDVHDFAWTASPGFLEFTDQWEHVRLRLLLRPEHERQARRHLQAAKTALALFDRELGPYPYPTLTLVDGVGGSNGMEYPTLITCGTSYGLPRWLRLLEMVIIHEFGHQYFYGMLASNEFEEAWLDEGFTSYFETRIMDQAYGPGSYIDLPGAPIGGEAFQRLQYTKGRPTAAPLFARSWDYASMNDYAMASYSKPVVALLALERYLGSETMQRVLKTYFNEWRFRHPTTRDFRETAERISGRDLGWFFETYVYGTEAVDYAVDDVMQDSAGGSHVRVHRKAQGRFPVTLRVRFEDGSTSDLTWDGGAEWKTFSFDGPVVEAFVDPENEIPLDLNRLNNRQTLEPDNTLARKVQLKLVVWLQVVLGLLSAFV